MINLPLYFNCCCMYEDADEKIYTYKIESNENDQYPFQLFKLKNSVPGQWDDLSVYASLHDAIKILLHELFSPGIAEAIGHGQTFLNVESILTLINHGSSSITISNLGNNNVLLGHYDIILDNLLQTEQPIHHN